MLPPDFTSSMTGGYRGTDDIRQSQWADAEIAAVSVLGTTELADALVVQRWHETRVDASFEMVNVFMSDPASGVAMVSPGSLNALGMKYQVVLLVVRPAGTVRAVEPTV